MRNLRLAALSGTIVLALGAAGCGEDGVPLSGSIRIDGSSTVAPLTKAIATRFMAEHPDVRVSVGASGTRRGFGKLCRGETDAGDAPDRIDEKTIAACERSGVGWGEIAVANDALILFVNPANPVRCLTMDQLSQIWHGNSSVRDHWFQIRDLNPPYDAEFIAWGPGVDTETFAAFTKAVNGVAGVTRDYNNSLHDERHPLDVVAESAGALGYADHPLYAATTERVRALEIDSGDGCVAPSPTTIADGTFRPLARRLRLYPSAQALARPEMAAFLRFYLVNVERVAPKVGFIALTDEQLTESRATLNRLIAKAHGSRTEDSG